MGIHWELYLLAVAFSVFCSGSQNGFNDDSALDENSYNLNWMDSIPDGTPISTISIPGTHESLTLYGLKQRQVWTLDKQLKAGVRYFDVHAGNLVYSSQRVDISEGRWIFWKRAHFDEVLKIILDYLEAHDSETVLLRVTLHGLQKRKDAKLILKLIQNFKDKIWTKLSVPNMQQARGKVVFLQSDNMNVGVLNHDTFFVGDDKFKDVEKQMNKVKKYLMAAEKNCADHIVLTRTTASSLFYNPKRVAREVNNQLIDLMVKHNQISSMPSCLGVLATNFPSADLIRKITEINPCVCGTEKGHVGAPTEQPQMSLRTATKPEATSESKPALEPYTVPEPAHTPKGNSETTSKLVQDLTLKPHSVSYPVSESKSSPSEKGSEQTLGPHTDPEHASESKQNPEPYTTPGPEPESSTSQQGIDHTLEQHANLTPLTETAAEAHTEPKSPTSKQGSHSTLEPHISLEPAAKSTMYTEPHIITESGDKSPPSELGSEPTRDSSTIPEHRFQSVPTLETHTTPIPASKPPTSDQILQETLEPHTTPDLRSQQEPQSTLETSTTPEKSTDPGSPRSDQVSEQANDHHTSSELPPIESNASTETGSSTSKHGLEPPSEPYTHPEYESQSTLKQHTTYEPVPESKSEIALQQTLEPHSTPELASKQEGGPTVEPHITPEKVTASESPRSEPVSEQAVHTSSGPLLEKESKATHEHATTSGTTPCSESVTSQPGSDLPQTDPESESELKLNSVQHTTPKLVTRWITSQQGLETTLPLQSGQTSEPPASKPPTSDQILQETLEPHTTPDLRSQQEPQPTLETYTTPEKSTDPGSPRSDQVSEQANDHHTSSELPPIESNTSAETGSSTSKQGLETPSEPYTHPEHEFQSTLEQRITFEHAPESPSEKALQQTLEPHTTPEHASTQGPRPTDESHITPDKATASESPRSEPVSEQAVHTSSGLQPETKSTPTTPEPLTMTEITPWPESVTSQQGSAPTPVSHTSPEPASEPSPMKSHTSVETGSSTSKQGLKAPSEPYTHPEQEFQSTLEQRITFEPAPESPSEKALQQTSEPHTTPEHASTQGPRPTDESHITPDKATASESPRSEPVSEQAVHTSSGLQPETKSTPTTPEPLTMTEITPWPESVTSQQGSAPTPESHTSPEPASEPSPMKSHTSVETGSSTSKQGLKAPSEPYTHPEHEFQLTLEQRITFEPAPESPSEKAPQQTSEPHTTPEHASTQGPRPTDESHITPDKATASESPRSESVSEQAVHTSSGLLPEAKSTPTTPEPITMTEITPWPESVSSQQGSAPTPESHTSPEPASEPSPTKSHTSAEPEPKSPTPEHTLEQISQTQTNFKPADESELPKPRSTHEAPPKTEPIHRSNEISTPEPASLTFKPGLEQRTENHVTLRPVSDSNPSLNPHTTNKPVPKKEPQKKKKNCHGRKMTKKIRLN